MSLPTVVASNKFHFPGGLEEVSRQLVYHQAHEGSTVYVLATDVESGRQNGITFIPVKVFGPDFLQAILYALRATMIIRRIRRTTGGIRLFAVGSGIFDADCTVLVGSSHKSAIRQLNLFRWARKSARRIHPLHLVTIMIEWLSYRMARVVVAPSKFVAQEIEQDYGARRIRVVPHAVNRATFHPASDELRGKARSRLGYKPHEKLVVFVANECARKGWDVVRTSLELLPPIYKCVIVGKCMPEAESPGRIQALGVLSREDVAAVMQAGDCLVLPSYYEPFGLVVIEALSCGLPVITTQNVGAAEWVRDGENGRTIESTTATDKATRLLADAIINVTAEDSWQTLSSNASESVSHLTWDGVLTQIAKL